MTLSILIGMERLWNELHTVMCCITDPLFTSAAQTQQSVTFLLAEFSWCHWILCTGQLISSLSPHIKSHSELLFAHGLRCFIINVTMIFKIILTQQDNLSCRVHREAKYLSCSDEKIWLFLYFVCVWTLE